MIKQNSSDYDILARYDYEPFGKRISVDAAPGGERLSFIGKEQDLENSLGDFGVRKYDEEIGRFTSIDPLFEKYAGLNPYHYCGNNPVSMKDPTGYIIEWDKAVDNNTKKNIIKFYQTTNTLKKQWEDMDNDDNTVTITIRGSKLAEKYSQNKPINDHFVFAKNEDNKKNGIGTDAIMALNKDQINNSVLHGEKSNHFKLTAATLGHEGAHAVGALKGEQVDPYPLFLNQTSREEVRAMGIENWIRGELKLPYMNHYPATKGKELPIPLGPSIPYIEVELK